MEASKAASWFSLNRLLASSMVCDCKRTLEYVAVVEYGRKLGVWRRSSEDTLALFQVGQYLVPYLVLDPYNTLALVIAYVQRVGEVLSAVDQVVQRVDDQAIARTVEYVVLHQIQSTLKFTVNVLF